MKKEHLLPAALTIIFLSGCSHWPLGGGQPAIALKSGEYVLTSSHVLKEGDIYDPKQGFESRNIFTSLSTSCPEEKFRLPPEATTFKRDLGKNAAFHLINYYKAKIGIGISTVHTAWIEVSSGTQTRIDYEKLQDCIQSLSVSDRDKFITRWSGDKEIVTDIISGIYTVKFFSGPSSSLDTPIVLATATISGTDNETGIGRVLFITKPLRETARYLSLQPKEVIFAEDSVVKDVTIQRSGEGTMRWHLIRPGQSGGFICLPGDGEMPERDTDKLYIVRLPKVLRSDEREIMPEGGSKGDTLKISAETPEIPTISYAKYAPLDDDPDYVKDLVQGLSKYYLQDRKGAARIFKDLQKKIPALENEPAFHEIRDSNDDFLRKSATKRAAIDDLFRYANSGFGIGKYGDGPFGGSPLPTQAVTTIKNDPKLLDAVMREPVLGTAIRKDPALRDAFGLKTQ